jgi:uncharacterized protein (TIGR02270 family)
VAIVADVVERHAEEAAFLWLLRDAATDQPHFDLQSLGRLEERVEAHLDGLRVAGEAGYQIAWDNFQQSPGPGELFTISLTALEGGDPTRIARTLDFAEAFPTARRGFFGALGWATRQTLRGEVAAWLQATVPFRRLAGVVACSLHRADPGGRMEDLLNDEPAIRARALRLAGELGRTDLQGRLAQALEDEDPFCRFWAAWSTGLLGDRVASIPRLEPYAAADGSLGRHALDLLVRLMKPDDGVNWLRQRSQDPSQTRLVVIAAGILGDSTVLPWLVRKMREPNLARVAGESFTMITGLDLSKSQLEGTRPDGVNAGPTDEPANENVAMDPDENLPWPDPNKLEAWWSEHGSRLPHSARLFVGLSLGEGICLKVWQEGYQRQRRAAAFELALMRPGSHLWNWRARSSVQARWLQPVRPG